MSPAAHRSSSDFDARVQSLTTSTGSAGSGLSHAGSTERGSAVDYRCRVSERGEWESRVAAFWESFDDSKPEEMLTGMRALVGERPEGDAQALAEWGGVHDALDLGAQAVEPYRRALAAGLSLEEEHRVTLQLASTLRNLGHVDESIALLEHLDAPELGGAPAAFLALALHSAGRPDEALRTALTALAPHLPMYGRALTDYAAELTPDT